MRPSTTAGFGTCTSPTSRPCSLARSQCECQSRGTVGASLVSQHRSACAGKENAPCSSVCVRAISTARKRESRHNCSVTPASAAPSCSSRPRSAARLTRSAVGTDRRSGAEVGVGSVGAAASPGCVAMGASGPGDVGVDPGTGVSMPLTDHSDHPETAVSSSRRKITREALTPASYGLAAVSTRHRRRPRREASVCRDAPVGQWRHALHDGQLRRRQRRAAFVRLRVLAERSTGSSGCRAGCWPSSASAWHRARCRRGGRSCR